MSVRDLRDDLKAAATELTSTTDDMSNFTGEEKTILRRAASRMVEAAGFLDKYLDIQNGND